MFYNRLSFSLSALATSATVRKLCRSFDNQNGDFMVAYQMLKNTPSELLHQLSLSVPPRAFPPSHTLHHILYYHCAHVPAVAFMFLEKSHPVLLITLTIVFKKKKSWCQLFVIFKHIKWRSQCSFRHYCLYLSCLLALSGLYHKIKQKYCMDTGEKFVIFKIMWKTIYFHMILLAGKAMRSC